MVSFAEQNHKADECPVCRDLSARVETMVDEMLEVTSGEDIYEAVAAVYETARQMLRVLHALPDSTLRMDKALVELMGDSVTTYLLTVTAVASEALHESTD